MFPAGIEKQLSQKTLMEGWQKGKLRLDSCRDGKKAGTGSISAVGMMLENVTGLMRKASRPLREKKEYGVFLFRQK